MLLVQIVTELVKVNITYINKCLTLVSVAGHMNILILNISLWHIQSNVTDGDAQNVKKKNMQKDLIQQQL